MENKNKGIFERSEKTVFVWVSKKYRVRRSSQRLQVTTAGSQKQKPSLLDQDGE